MKRQVRLAGRALPMSGLQFEGLQVSDFSRPAGSPEMTIQTSGPEDSPTMMHGRWCDKYLSRVSDNGVSVEPEAVAELNGQQVNSAFELVELVDDIRRQGQEVEFKWHRVTRRGLLYRFMFRPLTARDVDWEIEFKWSSQGEEVPPAHIVVPVSLGSVQTAWGDALRKVDFDVIPNVTGLVASHQAIVEASRKELRAVIAQAVGSASLAIGSPSRALSPARELAGLVVLIDQHAADLADVARSSLRASFGVAEMSSAAALAAFRDEGAAPLDYSVGSYLTAMLGQRRIVEMCDGFRATAAEQLADFEDQIGASVVAVVTGQQGVFDDLRDVAALVYGDHEAWRRLAVFNEVESSAVLPGQIVVCPQRENTR